MSPLGTPGEVLQGGAPSRCATPGTSTPAAAVPATSTTARAPPLPPPPPPPDRTCRGHPARDGCFVDNGKEKGGNHDSRRDGFMNCQDEPRPRHRVRSERGRPQPGRSSGTTGPSTRRCEVTTTTTTPTTTTQGMGSSVMQTFRVSTSRSGGSGLAPHHDASTDLAMRQSRRRLALRWSRRRP